MLRHRASSGAMLRCTSSSTRRRGRRNEVKGASGLLARGGADVVAGLVQLFDKAVRQLPRLLRIDANLGDGAVPVAFTVAHGQCVGVDPKFVDSVLVPTDLFEKGSGLAPG